MLEKVIEADSKLGINLQQLCDQRAQFLAARLQTMSNNSILTQKNLWEIYPSMCLPQQLLQRVDRIGTEWRLASQTLEQYRALNHIT
jgi:hypothetical protein